jgi:hypothetical protein
VCATTTTRYEVTAKALRFLARHADQLVAGSELPAVGALLPHLKACAVSSATKVRPPAADAWDACLAAVGFALHRQAHALNRRASGGGENGSSDDDDGDCDDGGGGGSGSGSGSSAAMSTALERARAEAAAAVKMQILRPPHAHFLATPFLLVWGLVGAAVHPLMWCIR